MDILEYKSGVLEDVDLKTRTITGWASVFGNIDSDNDIIEKGAYRKTLAENADNIRFLYNHNWEKPLQKGLANGQRNIKLWEEDYGLKFEAVIPTGLSYGDDLMILYENGIVDEHSIGFEVIKATKESASKPRVIKEVKLWEFSSVTMASNSLAKLESIKSADASKYISDQNKKIKSIMNVLRNGNLTDETCLLLEYAIKQIQDASYKLGKKHSTEQVKPSADTSQDFEPLINTIKNFKL